MGNLLPAQWADVDSPFLWSRHPIAERFAAGNTKPVPIRTRETY